MTRKTITILAAGDFPRREGVLRLLDEADMIICCDSAAAALVASGREPALIVGDLDSLSEELREMFASRLRIVTDQETNDLTKAVHVALEYSPRQIHILGATGRREDHTLGNISLLMEYQRMADCEIDIISDYGVFLAARGPRTFAAVPGQEISIFAFDSRLRLTATGLEYPLDGVVFDSLWKATLNRAAGREFIITPSGNAPYLVYLCNPGL